MNRPNANGFITDIDHERLASAVPRANLGNHVETRTGPCQFVPTGQAADRAGQTGPRQIGRRQIGPRVTYRMPAAGRPPAIRAATTSLWRLANGTVVDAHLPRAVGEDDRAYACFPRVLSLSVGGAEGAQAANHLGGDGSVPCRGEGGRPRAKPLEGARAGRVGRLQDPFPPQVASALSLVVGMGCCLRRSTLDAPGGPLSFLSAWGHADCIESPRPFGPASVRPLRPRRFSCEAGRDSSP